MRTVKVYSTSTGLKLVSSDATTWGQLKEHLFSQGVNVNFMKAVENKTNTTLELDDARLPETDFVLMLSPEKTKSGSSYLEIRNEISVLVKSSESADRFFNSGRNYTTKSRSELESLLSAWYENQDEQSDNAYSFNTIEKCITHLMETNEYDLRTNDFEKAFELLRGEITVEDEINANLNTEEAEWLSKMRHNL